MELESAHPFSSHDNIRIALQRDAVPYFPFSLNCDGDCWTFQNPLSHIVQKMNPFAHQILALCDGYCTWEEITLEIAKKHRIDRADVIRRSGRLLEDLTDEGMLWWRRQRMRWWDLPPPTAVLWDLTSSCNLSCHHCVVAGGSPKRNNDLSLNRCKHLIEELADFGVSQLILSGGEPLMRDDFFEIVEHAANRGLSLQVATNATLIDISAAKRLGKLHAYAQVSLDGATPEVHDRFRQSPGSWLSTVEGIRNLVAVNVPVTIAATITKNNIYQIPLLYELAVDLEVQAFRILPFVPYGRGRFYRDLEVAPRDMRDLVGFLLRMRECGEIPIVPMEFECTFSPPQEVLPHPQMRIGCDGAVAYCTITSNGEVLPCNFFSGASAENVKEHNFSWIWRHSRILNYFRSITLSDLHGYCQSCAWLGRCRGSCIAASFAHGDIFKSNCHCWLVEKTSSKIG